MSRALVFVALAVLGVAAPAIAADPPYPPEVEEAISTVETPLARCYWNDVLEADDEASDPQEFARSVLRVCRPSVVEAFTRAFQAKGIPVSLVPEMADRFERAYEADVVKWTLELRGD